MTFLNVVEIESALGALNATYPSLTQLMTLPNATVEGRLSHALLIRGNAKYKCKRPGVVLISGAHAREWGGPDILVNLATDLLEAYTANAGLAYGGKTFSAAEIGSIVERVDVIVFPDINPDGRAYSMAAAAGSTQAMWRKNRNGPGVDVNRNYDFLWDFPVKFSAAANQNTLASNNPASDIYHGTAPFSEAETKNVRWLVEQHPRTRWFVDVHSYGGDILYPWGDDENQTTTTSMAFGNPAWDHQRGVSGDTYREYMPQSYLIAVQDAATLMRDAISAVRGLSYATAQSFWLPGWPSYPTSGASDDWAFSRDFVSASNAHINGFVFEFNKNQTFFPTWAQMADIIADIDAGLVALCLHARPSWIWVILCWITSWFYAIWKRVFPPELWGPYGPWSRIRRVVSDIVARVVRVVGIGRRG